MSGGGLRRAVGRLAMRRRARAAASDATTADRDLRVCPNGPAATQPQTVCTVCRQRPTTRVRASFIRPGSPKACARAGRRLGGVAAGQAAPALPACRRRRLGCWRACRHYLTCWPHHLTSQLPASKLQTVHPAVLPCSSLLNHSTLQQWPVHAWQLLASRLSWMWRSSCSPTRSTVLALSQRYRRRTARRRHIAVQCHGGLTMAKKRWPRCAGGQLVLRPGRPQGGSCPSQVPCLQVEPSAKAALMSAVTHLICSPHSSSLQRHQRILSPPRPCSARLAAPHARCRPAQSSSLCGEGLYCAGGNGCSQLLPVPGIAVRRKQRGSAAADAAGRAVACVWGPANAQYEPGGRCGSVGRQAAWRSHRISIPSAPAAHAGCPLPVDPSQLHCCCNTSGLIRAVCSVDGVCGSSCGAVRGRQQGRWASHPTAAGFVLSC